MKLHIKFDINKLYKAILKDQLNKLGIPYKIKHLSEVELSNNVSGDSYKELESSLQKYGADILSSREDLIIQKVKETIKEMILLDESQLNVTQSEYIASKAKQSYLYLSTLFHKTTYMTIQRYIILTKLEFAKEFILSNRKFSEIAWQLKYSSIGHFSFQFKKYIGLSPTNFKKIIRKRNTLYNK